MPFWLVGRLLVGVIGGSLLDWHCGCGERFYSWILAIEAVLYLLVLMLLTQLLLRRAQGKLFQEPVLPSGYMSPYMHTQDCSSSSAGTCWCTYV